MIYLVGVNHCYQFVNDEFKSGGETLEKYLSQVVKEKSVKAIVEEFNEDARKLWRAERVIGEEVAKANKLSHAFCEPSEEERKELGIEGENAILKKMLGIAFNPGEDKKPEVQKAMAEDFHKRESYWYEVLAKYIEDDTVFICGYSHIDSFSKMLGDKGCEFELLASFEELVK